MASNGASPRIVDATENSLDKIKRQLASGSGRNLLQGPLFKRSETLRKWNERWVILDPTTGKMEYKTRRNEPTIKGTFLFDEIAQSPSLLSTSRGFQNIMVAVFILVHHRRKITFCVQRLLVQLKLGSQPYMRHS